MSDSLQPKYLSSYNGGKNTVREKREVLRAPLKTVLFRDGGVSRVLKSSCIRPYTPVFRARLPCPHQNAWFLEVPLLFRKSSLREELV